jgi:hypothetical protein
MRTMRLASASDVDQRCATARGRLVSIFLSVSLLIGAGCKSVGPTKLVPTHEGYNEAVQLVVTREVLLNVVRERYNDPSQFISVASINAQFSVSGETSGGAGGLGGATAGQLGGSIAYSDAPTITFVPQSGAGAYKSLFAPISLEEAIAYVYNFGRLRPHEVGLVIGSINHAQERAGVAGDAYRDNLAALVRLFDAGATFQYFREFRAGHFVSIPKDRLTGRDLAEASGAGQHFYDNGDGTVGLGEMHLAVGLVVPTPHRGQTAVDLKRLGLTPGKSLYPVRPPSLATPDPVGIQPDTLWLTPRSAERILELATLNVEVPEEHRRDGIAPPAELLLNSGLELPLRIRHATRRPDSPYRVKHRGYWFYIDDADVESKRIFHGLVITYQSRIGWSTPDSAAPQIVLPIGGG